MIRSIETESPRMTRRDFLVKSAKAILIAGTGVGVAAELKFSVDRAVAEERAKKIKNDGK